MSAKPGSFFRRWDVATCKVRIRDCSAADLPELEAAFAAERATSKPRKRLVHALKNRINFFVGRKL